MFLPRLSAGKEQGEQDSSILLMGEGGSSPEETDQQAGRFTVHSKTKDDNGRRMCALCVHVCIMCVHMYVRMCLCPRVYAFVCVPVYVHTCMCVCMPMCLCTRVCVSVCVCVLTCTCGQVEARVQPQMLSTFGLVCF